MSIDSIKQSVFRRFAERCADIAGLPAGSIHVLSNPTEELVDGIRKGRPVKMFAAGKRMLSSAATGAKARLEENYLYDTRRFASGAQTAGENIFFQSAVGQPGVNNGFTAGLVMTELETNMDVPGQIAQGKNFVFNQLGVSFNAQITATDCATMLEAGALRFEKQGGQFTLRHGPVKLWPGCTGVGGFAATTANDTTISGVSNGNQDLRAARKLNIPRVIREKDAFAYKFVIPRAVSNLDGSTAITLVNSVTMTIWLWGGQQDSIPV